MPQPNPRVQLLAPDTVLQQRYRIERHIGTGGYANVYRAIDLQHRRERAIKEVFDTDDGVRKQFEVEAGLLIQSTHPNIPRGYQLFEERGRLYLVMEFVRGRDLEDLLNESLVQRRRPLDEAQVLTWAIEVCGALTEMHDREPPVIHRDIKPANIKITPDGHPVLIDFGLAKVQAHGPTHTAAQGVSPGFAPPEQYMAKGATDARTDIYGMGATLYACLTGKDPPDAPSRLLAQTGTTGQPMIPPRDLAARTAVISEPANRLVVRALELAPSQRQQSAQELRDELIAARSWLAANGARPGSGGLVPGSGGLNSGKNPASPRLVSPGASGGGQPPVMPAFPPAAAQPATGKPPVVSAKPQPVPPAAPGMIPAAKPAAKPAKPAARGPVSPLAPPVAVPPPHLANPPMTTQQPVAPLPFATKQQPAARVERFEAFPAPSAAPAPMAPTAPTLMAAPASASRTSGSRGGAAVALAEEPVTAGALALAVPAVPAPNSRKRRGAASQSALVGAPPVQETASPRPWLDLKGLELKALGKAALGLAAVETCWGVFLLSLGVLQLATRGQDRLQPYFVLALIWLCVVVLVIALGGQALSRPVRRRGKLTPLRRGLQGAGLTLHAVAVHGLAIWGAIMLGQHRLDPGLAAFAFGLFAVNVLAGGVFSLINTLG
ncbi:MAG TPA: serine/threonine-protein kinase [Ktedonobacterales bacterium]